MNNVPTVLELMYFLLGNIYKMLSDLLQVVFNLYIQTYTVTDKKHEHYLDSLATDTQ